MSTLRQCIEALPTEAIISDGGTDWDAANLIEAIEVSDLDAAAVGTWADDDQLGVIALIDDHGYQISPPAYTWRCRDAQTANG